MERRARIGLLALVATGCSMPPQEGVHAGSRSGIDAGEAGVDPQIEAARRVLAPQSPETLPPPPPDESSRLADDPRAAALGQRFFFDPGFSGQLIDSDNNGSPGTLGVQGQTGKVACVGCHVPEAGFGDDRSPRHQIPLGAMWGLRRVKPLLDVGQSKLLMWDGRADAMYNQAFIPLELPAEMNSARLFVAEQIYQRYRNDYEALFGSMPPLGDATRFPALTAAQAGCQPVSGSAATLRCHGKPGDQAEFDGMQPSDQDLVTQVVVNMGKALGAYERLLTCGPARFDQWMHGNASAMTGSEQHGAVVFVRSGCPLCHSGPYFSDQQFHNVGLEPSPVVSAFSDRNEPGAAVGLPEILGNPLNTRSKFSDGYDGRLPSTVGVSMDGAFRTPSLRCVATRPSFMHTGQYRALADVVAFFSRGGDQQGFPGTSQNWARNLSDEDAADLVSFLQTLDGPGPDAKLLSAPP
jgi:cytochrome c peroxidase